MSAANDTTTKLSQQLAAALATNDASAALEVADATLRETEIAAEPAMELLNHAFTIATIGDASLDKIPTRLPRTTAVVVYHPWLGVDYVQLVRKGIAAGMLLPIFAGLRTGGERSFPALDETNFRVFEYRGINLWQICEYHACLTFGCMPEAISIATDDARKTLRDLYVYASELIDEAIDFLRFYRPCAVLLAQGHFPISAVMRHLCVAAGVRVVSIEITLRRDRMLWEDLVGAAVNTHLARNYYWRYLPSVTIEEADATCTKYLANLPNLKAAEHATPVHGAPLPESSRPTLLYLGQVSTDAAVLYGRRGFRSQAEAVIAAARYAANRGLRLVVKLHPKESPQHQDPLPFFRQLTWRWLEREPQFQAVRQLLGGELIIDADNRWNTYELINGASACVTLNSQAGLEALLMGKEVILAGEAAFGHLGFTHEVDDEPSLHFCLDRVLQQGLRRNDGVSCRRYFHVFTELYCVPKNEDSILTLVSGRPAFPRLGKAEWIPTADRAAHDGSAAPLEKPKTGAKDFSYASGERQTATHLSEIRRDHSSRYELAVEMVRGHFPPGQPLRGLDVFCGNGYGTWLAAQRLGASVMGIDGSEEAIAIANRHFSNEHTVFSAKRFPFAIPAESYDFILCFESIEHVEQPEAFFVQLANSLKPGGVLFVSTPNEATMPFAKNAAWFRHHVRHFSRDDMRALADQVSGMRLAGEFGQTVYRIAPDGKVTGIDATQDMLPHTDLTTAHFLMHAYLKTTTRATATPAFEEDNNPSRVADPSIFCRSELMLDVGCGEAGPQPGHVGVDIRPLPGVAILSNAWSLEQHLAPNSVSGFYSRHTLEHLTFPQLRNTLKSWLRLLRPGGRIHVLVPDLEFHIQQFLDPIATNPSPTNPAWTQRQHALAGFYGWQREADHKLWDVHKSGHTAETMHELLREIGFVRFRRLENQPWHLDFEAFKSE